MKNGLGISWELADPKCDPEFLYHLIFIGNKKNEIIDQISLLDWMLKFYLLNDPSILSEKQEFNAGYWAVKMMEVKENILVPFVHLWIKYGFLRKIWHGSKIYKLKILVEPRRIDQNALRDKKHVYL
jgi:hypothetical protein